MCFTWVQELLSHHPQARNPQKVLNSFETRPDYIILDLT